MAGSTVACVVAGLGAGGAERVLTTLAGRWAERGHRVTVVTIGGSGDDFYSLSPKVDRVALGMATPSTNQITGVVANLKRIAALRRALERIGPGTIVSFGDQTNV